MLACSTCPARYDDDRPRWRCDCGGYLMLEETAMFTRASLDSRPSTLWRYFEAFGIRDPSNVVSLGEGNTPIVSDRWGRRRTMFKFDYLCPTGSYKDRGSAVMMSKLKEWGVGEIIEDSSGNAGASIAAYASLAGIRSHIYVPAGTSPGKAAQIRTYGADLVCVQGSREDTAAAALDAASHSYYASHNWNPYFVAGMKTVAYEIAEQLSWHTPEWVIVPAGGGGLLVGLHLGFRDLHNAGLIRTVPRLIAVQSASCDPIYRAWADGLDHVPAVRKSDTAAEGISVAKPVRGKAILQAIRETRGFVRTVTDDRVWSTLEALGAQGIYIEPTSAAAPAALDALVDDGVIQENEVALIVLTGSGLKATDKIVQHYAAREPAMVSRSTRP